MTIFFAFQKCMSIKNVIQITSDNVRSSYSQHDSHWQNVTETHSAETIMCCANFHARSRDKMAWHWLSCLDSAVLNCFDY